MWSKEEEERLIRYLIARVTDKALGRIEPECVKNRPSDTYFIGNLRPVDATETSASFRELMSKLAPVAFGAEFLLLPNPGEGEPEVQVQVSWACYYRVVPSYAQQYEHQRGTDAREESTRQSREIDTDGSSPRRRRENSRDSLALRFKKIECSASATVYVRQVEEGVWEVDRQPLAEAINSELRRAEQIFREDPSRIRGSSSAEKEVRVPRSALSSTGAFEEFTNSLSAEIEGLSWQLDCRFACRRTGSGPGGPFILKADFVNRSSNDGGNPNWEPFLFDTSAQFSFRNAEVKPFELDLAPRGFRYDRLLWGRGFNCGVEALDREKESFVTVHTPIFKQYRYETRTEPTARFEELASDPVPVLEQVLEAMRQYLAVWGRLRETYVSRPDWNQAYQDEFDRDLRQYEDEIRRFSVGMDLLKENKDLALAFRLTNRTFQRLGDDPRKPKVAWRLFQLVFLVTQIPSLAALINGYEEFADEREMVDIVFFPTGGGKTEAYLGTIILHCFLDRLRGKSAGVTAWTRFPLRLLTLQQTQRMADVVAIADLVRRASEDPRLSSPSVDGFAVGYFVGQGGSPNELVSPSYPYSRERHQVDWQTASDPDARQRWKRVTICPSCRTSSVYVDFDPDSVEIIHRCSQEDCLFRDGRIPVYIVDNEIYRYLPSVMVGTIDKLASLGNQRKMAQVFGAVEGRCEKHGYYLRRCCQKDCDNSTLVQGEPEGVSSPTLFVQDELHLLKEGLGTFDSHYESFSQELRRELGDRACLKIIASSATVESFERQVEHLYGRSRTVARVFPGNGPALGESFYATTRDYAQRLFVGLMPHNKTIFNAMLELIEAYHREIQLLQNLTTGSTNPYGGEIEVGSASWIELLDFYATSLTYFLASQQLDEIRTDIDGDVNGNLREDQLLPLSIEQLTGSTSTDEVTEALDKLERPASPGARPDAVLATSMISHGVDVDRFNSMFFYGMPRQNAEYIQASSRVGRRLAGVVFVCNHPARERDRSHFTYFCKYHEFLGQLVEPVAINRWATFSVNRTLPGLFMATLLQLLSNQERAANPNKFYLLDFVKSRFSDGTLTADDFLPLLERTYLNATGTREALERFQDEIRLRVPQFIDQILAADPTVNWVSSCLIPRPMRSLRDVDEPVPIELDFSRRS